MKKTENSAGDNASPETIEDESMLVPLLLCEVSCGFPSPAEDYIEEPIEVTEEMDVEILGKITYSINKQ